MGGDNEMTTSGWPSFELASFTAWDSVPDDARQALQAVQLPRNFFGSRYMTIPEPLVVEFPDGRRLVQFGQTMLFGKVYFDPSTGQVLERVDRPWASTQFVNSSLGQFTSTIRAVLDMFPFYDGNSELEERMGVTATISNIVGRIDPAALDPNGFWGTFLDDVTNGDFATEDVLGTG